MSSVLHLFLTKNLSSDSLADLCGIALKFSWLDLFRSFIVAFLHTGGKVQFAHSFSYCVYKLALFSAILLTTSL
jgi:hypothetical protein